MCVSPTVPNSTMVTRRLSNELSSHARMEGSSHTSTCPNRSWICPRLIWSDCLYLGWKIWASSAKWFGKPADSILKFSKPTMVRFQTWSRTFFVGVCWRFGFCFFSPYSEKMNLPDARTSWSAWPWRFGHSSFLNLSVTSAASSTQGVFWIPITARFQAFLPSTFCYVLCHRLP